MKKFRSFLFLAIVATALQARWISFDGNQVEKPPQFEVVSSSPQKTVVELNLAGFYRTDTSVQGTSFQIVNLGIAAGGILPEIGAPQVPVVARFIAIPDDRDVRIEVVQLDTVRLRGYYIYPVQPPLPENQSRPPFAIDEKRYQTDEFYPAVFARVSEPMIMRDFRLVQLVLQPLQFNPVAKELLVARKLRIALHYDNPSNVNVKTRRTATISRAFEPLYRSFIANYRFLRPNRAEDGSYLIITHDSFASAVAPFARWKQRKGWRTKVVTLSEIGGNDTALIYNYIHNAYLNWPYPPDYVLLVGDAPQFLRCNHWPGQTDASDLYYSLHEGNDILADLYIARVCVRTSAEAQAVLNKLYKYEMEPDLTNPDWFNKVCALAGYESGSPGRFWTVVIRIRNYVMGRPFVQFDTLFQRWGLNTAQNLTDSLNAGRAWMLYRGHGDNDAWANVSPSWTNSNVYGLSNGRMTPMVIAPTCLSGNFDEPTDCHAEAWLKAGETRGGIGYFGSSEVSYSGYNDSLAAGTFISYVDSLAYTFAQCTQWGKLFMLLAYPLPNQTSEEEIYMFNNFGEPELNVWSKTPQTLLVEHPATVPIGSFNFPVQVSSGGNPIANAQVCVMSLQDTTMYYVGHTDASGAVTFNINSTIAGDSLYVTVTGRNLLPYLGAALTIAPSTPYCTYLRSTVNDSLGGNNDRIINPGEAIELPVWIKNWGSISAVNVRATLRCTDPQITITDSVKHFGTILPGDSAFTGTDGFNFSVAPGCTNRYSLRFNLECRDQADSVWHSNFTLSVGTPVIVYTTKQIYDPLPGGNNNGRLDRGETAQLFLTIRNIGLGHGYNVTGKVRSADPRLQVLDSLAQFGFIPRDSLGTNSADPFVIYADTSLIRETAISCTLIVTAQDGYNFTLPWQIVVNEIRASDPIPDNAEPPHYWAYDDSDTLYAQHPQFNWIEIRNRGTRLTLTDDETRQITLPATFGPLKFYGTNYTQISICSNGWAAPGYTTLTTYQNTALPNTAMPPLLAVNWDDLYPPTGNSVWYYHDTAQHRFIIEWDSVHYFNPRDQWDKFQIVIYDTTVPTPTGENRIEFQYLTANYTASSTVGIQNHTGSFAIQYLFDNSYHRGAAGVNPGRAIRFITGEPNTGLAENLPEPQISRPELTVTPCPMRTHGLVRFALPAPSQISLKLFDITGRNVRTLSCGNLPAGIHQLTLNGQDEQGKELSPGVYFLRLAIENSGKNRTITVKTVIAR